MQCSGPYQQVEIFKNKDNNIWHVTPMGTICWEAIDKLMPTFTHHPVGADQQTYATVAVRNATRCLTRQDT